MRRTVRLFEAYTGSSYDVTDALTALTRSTRPGDVLLSDVEYGLSTLPASRLLPDMRARTPAKIIHALLEADDPLGRSELIDRVGCSGTTYDKHVDRLASFDLLRRVDGRKWTFSVAPWYVPETDAEKPAYESSPVAVGSTTVDQVVFDALDALGYDVGDPDMIEAFEQPLSKAKLIATVGAWIDDWIDVLSPLLKPNPALYSDLDRTSSRSGNDRTKRLSTEARGPHWRTNA